MRVFAGLLIALAPALAALPDDGTPTGVYFGRNAQLVAATEAMHRGEFERGISMMLDGLQNNIPIRQRAEAYSNLCAAYSALRQHDIALSYCNRSLALNSGNWRAHHNRAHALLGQGRFDEAVITARAALELAPEERKPQSLLRVANRSMANPRVIMEAFP